MRENQAFFKEVLDLFDPQDPEKIPLKFKSGDPESRSEAVVHPNGEVEVSFVIPLDSDADPENGRVYLRDTFVFDSSEKKLKSYQRAFDYNGKGEGNWAAWLEKYRETLKQPRGIDDKTVQDFAFSAGTSFGRALTDADGKTLEDFAKAYKREHEYLDLNHHMVEVNWQDLNYKLKDKANHYTLVRKDGQIHITFNMTIDGDDDPANGRLILSDTISVDEKTWKLTNFTRQWKPAHELADSEEWKAAAERMNQIWAETPADEKAKVAEKGQAFVVNMASLLLTGNDVEPKDAWKALLPNANSVTGPAEPSVFAKRSEKDPRRGEATPQILEAIGVLANESMARKQDSESGWWNRRVLRHGAIDLEQLQKSNIDVVKKALAAAKSKPAASAFEVLKSLSLEGDEAQARDWMLSSPNAIELNSIGVETDAELRATALLHFADGRLFRRAQMLASAQSILNGLQNSPFVQAKAKALLETMGGKGTFGSKVEAFLPHFTEQVAHPATLIAMGGAPFLGAAAEGAGLLGLSRFARVLGGSGRVNFAGRWLAGGGGLAGEAFAFTALHQAGASAVHDPNKVMANFGNEFLSGLMLFGAMRMSHAVVNPLSARVFTKTPTETQLLTSPTGRVLLNPRWGGGEANWLSRNVAIPFVNHGTGVLAMHGANSLARHWDLMPDDGKDGFSHFLESGLAYAQATIGFNLANRMTMGRLQGGLGEAKLRLDSFGREPVKKTGLAPGQAFNFNGKWKIEKAGEQKAIWIGSSPGRRKGVEYLDGYAKLNVGVEDTVSEYHAVLVRDRSGSFWYVADAGSTYGTFVGTRRLAPGEHARFKNNEVLQLGDSFQLRIGVDGKLLSPDRGAHIVVDVPQSPAQKRLGPPPTAETFPFEALYPGFDPMPSKEIQEAMGRRNEEVKPLAFEVAQLNSVKGGEGVKLTSATTFWRSKSSTLQIYVDKRGRFVLENLSFDTPIEVHRPARGQQAEERWNLIRTDPKFMSEEQRVAGRQDWVFLESGDIISMGNQSVEFIAHDLPIADKVQASSRALGHSERPPAPRDSVPPEDLDPNGDRVTEINLKRDPDLDPMGDRVTELNLKPVSPDGTHSENSEITQAIRPRLTNVDRLNGPLPDEYRNGIPANTPVFQLLLNGEVIGSGDPLNTSYLIGHKPDVHGSYQSSFAIGGRLLEATHAEIFLARTPSGEGYQWYLTDKDSAQGTFLGGRDGRKLDSGAGREFIPLQSGSTFSLGAPAGKNDAIELTFRLPWSATSIDPAKPAEVFPLKLLRDFAPNQAPMELIDNFGNVVFTADRKTTRYIFGKNPDPRETPNTRTVSLDYVRDPSRIADEHCEIFVSESGNWYLRSLTLEEKIYIDGQEVIPGATVPIRPEAEIALGGEKDKRQGHGITFRLRKENYATESDSETPTVRPAPPDGKAARPAAAPPPRRAPSEGDFNGGGVSDTLIMQASATEKLARQSVEMEEPPPPPQRPRQASRPPQTGGSGPHIMRRSQPPQPPAKRPPAPPLAEKPKEPAAPAPRNEADFGELNTEAPAAPVAPSGARQTASQEMPPPAPDLTQPVIPRHSPVPKEALHSEPIPPAPPAADVKLAPSPSPLEAAIAAAQPPKPVDPSLTTVHPDLRSQNLLDSISSWLTSDKERLKKKVNEIKTFPRHEPKEDSLSSSSVTLPLFLGQVLKREGEVKFSDPTKAVLKGLIDAKVGGDFGQVYDVSFDGKTLFYGSQGFSDPNTSLTLKIKPGAEAEVLRGLHEKLLTLDVPVQITAPLSTSTEAPSTYLGILYRAQDAAKVHQAVRNFAQDHSAALGMGNLPFTHMLRGENGRPITGSGVMEYFVDGKVPNPLDHRFRAMVLGSFNSYAKKAQAENKYEQLKHFQTALALYQQAGYDLANAGFRAGSLDGTHAPLRTELYFPE
ncbi:MAG TPA: FHA domain-containing protein [bacterium]|nr:FHA domain-containing protein [bacterium]